MLQGAHDPEENAASGSEDTSRGGAGCFGEGSAEAVGGAFDVLAHLPQT